MTLRSLFVKFKGQNYESLTGNIFLIFIMNTYCINWISLEKFSVTNSPFIHQIAIFLFRFKLQKGIRKAHIGVMNML